jgi:hypothetical protein
LNPRPELRRKIWFAGTQEHRMQAPVGRYAEKKILPRRSPRLRAG